MVEGADDVKRNLQKWSDRQRAAAIALARAWAERVEGRAKSDAPWTDRTSNARGGLFGVTDIRDDEVFIRLGHTVEYGVFLEMAKDGRFAILKPTLTKAAPEIYRDYKRLWE